MSDSRYEIPEETLIRSDISEYLAQHEHKDLLRHIQREGYVRVRINDETYDLKNLPELNKNDMGHNWWTIDLCFWSDAWSVTEKCKKAIDELNKKYG